MGGGDLIQVTAIPSSKYALRGVQAKINVLFNIKTEELENSTRPPINLAIVLDRSGSMRSRGKMECSKKAIKKVIENLSSKDIIHFVIYDDRADVVFSNKTTADAEQLYKLIDDVKCRGSTNLCAGLQLGADQVAIHNQTGFTQRVFLFSDGIVNQGIKDREAIYDVVQQQIYDKLDVKTSSFGVGDDYDEELMKGIAEVGCGAYFFIEGSDAIEKFVSEALEGLLTQVSSDTTLKIRGKNGGVLTKIFNYQDLIKGASLGDLRQDNLRQVCAQFDVSPNQNIDCEEFMTWELSYKAAHGEFVSEDFLKLEGGLEITYTDDESKIENNSEVLVAVTIQESSEKDSEISKLLDENKVEEAIAAQQEQVQFLANVMDRDTTGMIGALHSQANVNEGMIKSDGASKKNKKAIHHQKYMKRRASLKYMQSYV